jgi:hypothetical protein
MDRLIVYKIKQLFVLKNLVFILSILFGIDLLINGLIKGGRWDLNEQIALGIRLINGDFYYSSGIADYFAPSSPYFPGVGILSALFQKIGINNILILNQLMITISVFIGILYFYSLFRITKILFPSIPKNFIIVFISFLLITHFEMYKFYLNEFKPDTVLLLISSFTFFLLVDKKINKLVNIISVMILLFIASFFKQNAFLIFIFPILLILSSKELNLYKKIIYSTLCILTGVCALLLIFNIENCYLFTVDIMSKHPYSGIGGIIFYLLETFIFNPIFCSILFIFFINRIFKGFSLYQMSNSDIYFIFSLCWFIFQLFSMAKVGGNRGNSEVALIPFMPFIINQIFNHFKSLSLKKFDKFAIKYFAIPFLIYFILLFPFNIRELLIDKRNQLDAIEFLNQNYQNKKVFVDGNTIINASTAKLNVISEVETIGHFSNANSDKINSLNKVFMDKYYDIIYLSNLEELSKKLSNNTMNSIYNNYQLLNTIDLPISLDGKLYLSNKESE